ncbi:MAG: aryl-sulfate sulfotransferase, partial [Flavobacteriaceae bacterium]
MNHIKPLRLFFAFIFLFTLISCTSEDPITEEPVSQVGDQDSDNEESGNENDDEEMEEDTTDREGEVEFFNSEYVEDSYVLVNDAGNNRAYIMDKDAVLQHEWTLGNNIGNDVFLLPDGRLLAILEADAPLINFGGKGGKIQLIDKDSNILWNFDYSTEDYVIHHDVEMLPNGNIIAMVWEKRTTAEAEAAGSN